MQLYANMYNMYKNAQQYTDKVFKKKNIKYTKHTTQGLVWTFLCDNSSIDSL